MTEQILTYRDETLNLDRAYYYALLVEVATDAFSYAITYRDKLMACQNNCTLEELTEPLRLQDILSAHYKKIVIALPSAGFTLIPNSLFSNDHLQQIGHLLDVQENERLIAKPFDTENYIVFKVDKQLIEGLRKYGLQNIFFKPTGWVKALTQATPQNNQLFLNVDGGKLDIAYFENSRLRFYNCFDYFNTDDILYYTVTVAKELALVPAELSVIISGPLTTEDIVYASLYDFFGEVKINVSAPVELPGQIMPQQVLSLVSLSLCESSEVY